MTMPFFLYCLSSAAVMTFLIMFVFVRAVISLVLRRLHSRATIEVKMNRAWMRIPREERKLYAAMTCTRCVGTAEDPHYSFACSNEPAPCHACGGYGFDRFNHDFRRMRLLGVD